MGAGWLGGRYSSYIQNIFIQIHIHILHSSQSKNPSKRKISLSLAELKMYQKNIHKTRRQAGGFVWQNHVKPRVPEVIKPHLTPAALQHQAYRQFPGMFPTISGLIATHGPYKQVSAPWTADSADLGACQQLSPPSDSFGTRWSCLFCLSFLGAQVLERSLSLQISGHLQHPRDGGQTEEHCEEAPRPKRMSQTPQVTPPTSESFIEGF